jgi:hypothetical protein
MILSVIEIAEGGISKLGSISPKTSRQLKSASILEISEVQKIQAVLD